ncbi:MAG TPA: VWA domain-containing protein, partial [Candidatus Polarisedimenticolaceae bacterium]|nr:VWA domain-containing protein [Candidatus Polarisedimenticolaceae bacterium]
MNKFRLLVLLSLLATGAGAGPVVSAQEPSGVQERVTVTLVQVDALVIDKDGKTVPGLTKADFELILGGQPLEVATLDEACQIGATADPLPIEGDAPPAKVGDGIKRRIVFAFDYYFLETTMRAQILDAARSMLEFGKTDDDEVMIVALAYGVRVEQRFTNDLRQLVAALARMEHDVTLWARQFPLGASGEEYFDDLVTLMDVLEGYDGSKAVVLFSQARHIQTSMRDIFYNDVAMHALSARSAIYPANPDLLSGSGGGSDSLTRLANQSGGRMPFFTNDVSLPYRQAQRDLSCRYTVGAYLDNTEGKKRKSVAVRVKNDDYRTRHPEMIKLFTDEEKQENRSRAAFVDPEPYENPLVRADVYPVFPASRSTWDTLLMLTFPMPVAPGGADIEVAATLMRGATRVDKAKRELHIDPPPGGGDVRPVTVFADTKLKDGDHRLTVVLTEPGTDRLVTAEARFQVPPVFEDLLILRGPLFARTIPGGLFVRGDADKTADTKLDEILGEDKSFEPLLVNQIATSDELLYYWNACVLGKLELNGQAVVKRTLMDDAGEIVHRLPELPLELEPQARVKGLQCHSELETVAPNRIP